MKTVQRDPGQQGVLPWSQRLQTLDVHLHGVGKGRNKEPQPAEQAFVQHA